MSKLDALSKAEPVGDVQHLNELNDDWLQNLPIGTPLYTTDPRPLALLIRQLGDALAFYMTPPIGQLNDHHIEAAKKGMVALTAIAAFEKDD